VALLVCETAGRTCERDFYVMKDLNDIIQKGGGRFGRPRRNSHHVRLVGGQTHGKGNLPSLEPGMIQKHQVPNSFLSKPRPGVNPSDAGCQNSFSERRVKWES
jgi:hypothetical protein